MTGCCAANKSRVGGALLNALAGKDQGLLLVGTWASATRAIRLYKHHGFRLVSSGEEDRLLDTYWTISPRQRETSVVLEKSQEPGHGGRSN